MEAWSLKFEEFSPKEERLRETLLTLGNGYFATRGAGEEQKACAHHYPGTYIAGGYNRLHSALFGQDVENEDLVNWPNWLSITFKIDGHWFTPESVHVLEYVQELDLKKGVLKRRIHFEDDRKRESILECRRFVSMENVHVGAQEWVLTPKNWSGTVLIKTAIDCGVTNDGVERYRSLNNRHLVHGERKWPLAGIFQVESFSSQSKLRVIQSLRTELFQGDNPCAYVATPIDEHDVVGVLITQEVRMNEPLRVERTLTLFTSRDRSISEPGYEGLRLLERLPGFGRLLELHDIEWARLWNRCDIELPERHRETKLLRLHIFHLLQTVSLKTLDLDVGVPARGLHGEAYRGHIFWDELFILPFLNLRIPELSRALLMYRYRRLAEARINAREAGLKGAMFPWQSGSNGEEEGQRIHLNPISGNWIEDITHLQRHVNGAIVYNVWHYYQSTEDLEFISHYGIELALEICRFFASVFTYSESKSRYVLLGVVGPDEFHTHDPASGAPGVNNNAYTNYLASWSIRVTVDLFLNLPEDRQIEVLKTLQLTRKELNDWLQLSRKIFLPFYEGLLLPFEGAENLRELNLKAYAVKYGNVQRLDRILEAENDSINRYKVSKQADVLMLFYLFSPAEFVQGLAWLGYPFNEGDIEKNIEHHLSVTTHGSTLSRIVHAWVLARYDSTRAWQLFDQALETDVADLQGGTTAEGVHLGAMAGTLDLIQRCFTGIEIGRDRLSIKPSFPCEIQSLNTALHFRGHGLSLQIQNQVLEIRVKHSRLPSMKLQVLDTVYELKEGDQIKVQLKSCPLTVADSEGGINEFDRAVHSKGSAIPDASKHA